MMTTMMMMTRPIYKIICLIVLVTVGFSSIVAATAAAESTTDNNANKKNQAAISAGRILVRRPDSERQLAPPDRISIRFKEKEMEMIFTRAYTVVTSPKDVTLVDPPTIQGR